VKRWWLASVLAALVLPGEPALARDTAVREQSRFERDAAGLASVSVSNARGLVDIRPSADGRVRVVALKVVHSMSSSLGRELAEKTVVEIDQVRTDLQIRVRYPTHRVRLTFWGDLSGDRIPRVEVRLAIEAPAHLAVSITSASGDVVSEGRTGSQILHTASGDVDVSAAGGLCEVVTASGDVSLADVATTSVKTSSGEVR
jgi:DUF4097 and DUF4098 domain-containing protein YvlB